MAFQMAFVVNDGIGDPYVAQESVWVVDMEGVDHGRPGKTGRFVLHGWATMADLVAKRPHVGKKEYILPGTGAAYWILLGSPPQGATLLDAVSAACEAHAMATKDINNPDFDPQQPESEENPKKISFFKDATTVVLPPCHFNTPPQSALEEMGLVTPSTKATSTAAPGEAKRTRLELPAGFKERFNIPDDEKEQDRGQPNPDQDPDTEVDVPRERGKRRKR
jgi:hypothetical protein